MDPTLTPAAEKFVRRMIRMAGLPRGGLRLAVTLGGCSGLSADFSVVAAPPAAHAEIHLNGIPLFLSEESRILLEQVTIDFVETATQTGFVFHDPKPLACGCTTVDMVTIDGLEAVR